jgi:hypothetical protein
MVSGTRLLPGARAITYVKTLGGTAEACVPGTRLITNAGNAALTGGMLAHADDTDDTHALAVLHPGAGVVPAALAMAEREKAGGIALLRAGTIFVNPEALSASLGLAVQWLVEHAASGGDRIQVLADGDAAQVRAQLLQHPMLNEVVGGGLLQLEVIATPASQFQRHPQSGKTPLVLDQRRNTEPAR